MIVVAKKLSVLQLFISRMPKMCAILQLVSAPLNRFNADRIRPNYIPKERSQRDERLTVRLSYQKWRVIRSPQPDFVIVLK